MPPERKKETRTGHPIVKEAAAVLPKRNPNLPGSAAPSTAASPILCHQQQLSRNDAPLARPPDSSSSLCNRALLPICRRPRERRTQLRDVKTSSLSLIAS